MIWAIIWASFKLIIGPCVAACGFLLAALSLKYASSDRDRITFFILGVMIAAIGLMLAYLLTPTTFEAFLQL